MLNVSLYKSLKSKWGRVFYSICLFSLAFSFSVALPIPAQASIYAPGQTLEPDCVAGTSNCGVDPSLGLTLSTINNLLTSATSTLIGANSNFTSATTTNLYTSILSLGTALSVTNGGTGATNAAGALVNLGIVFATTSDVIAPNNQIVAWGDSLTQGEYPSDLGSLLNPVYNGGVGGETSTQIRNRMLAATDKYGYLTIIWAGNNNPTDPVSVKADIASMIAALASPKRYVILSIDNNAGSSYKGTSAYNTIIQLNADLATLYPDNYLDIRSYLVSQYDSSQPQDVIDYSNDVPPSSLRSDNIHLTSVGYLKVAQQIAEFIKQHYYSFSNKTLIQSNLVDLFGSPYSIGSVNPASGKFTDVKIASGGMIAAPLGSELTDATGWTSVGWTGNYNTGFIHNVGATTTLYRTVLSNIGASIAGRKYQITFTISNRTAGSFNVSFGAVDPNRTYSNNGTYQFGPTASTTDNLIFTPTSDFNGTISAVSVKEITNPYSSSFTILDSTGIPTLEIRSSSSVAAVSGNLFLGSYSGEYNTTGSSNTALGSAAMMVNTTGFDNTSIGRSSLYKNTTGFNNSAVGAFALNSNTTGSDNTANGVQSLFMNATGGSNVAFGMNALYSHITGDSNTAIGSSALFSATSTYSLVAVGSNALYSNTTGSRNTAIGDSSLRANTTGGSNTAQGYTALYKNTTGSNNTASGVSALSTNTTGHENTAIGVSALAANTGGYSNVAFGMNALNANTTGNNNTAIGMNALLSSVSGINNTAAGYGVLQNNLSATNTTAFGYAAGYGVSGTSNQNNSLFGYQSGRGLSTGSYNTFVGFQAGYGDGSTQDQRSVLDNYMTFIGYQASRDSSVASTTALTKSIAIGYNARVGTSSAMVLGGTGADAINVGIGTSSPAYTLDVEKGTAGAVAYFKAGANTCTLDPANVGGLSCSSDARLKTNIQSLDLSGVSSSALDKLVALRPVTYNWISDNQASSTHTGFIAQEVLPLFPDLVSTDSGGNYELSYSGFIPYIVSAIQDLNKKVGSTITSIPEWVGNKITVALGVFQKVQTNELQTDKLCTDDVCVTKDQLKQMLINAGGTVTNSVISQNPIATSSGEISTTTATITDLIIEPEATTTPLVVTPPTSPDETAATSSSSDI